MSYDGQKLLSRQNIKEHLFSKVYKEVSIDSDKKVSLNIKEHVKKYKSLLTKKEVDYLINFKFTSSQFYCLVKVHKSKIIKNVINTENSEYIQVHCRDDLKGRPERWCSESGLESPIQQLSNLVEILLKSLVPTLKAYIKYDWDF